MYTVRHPFTLAGHGASAVRCPAEARNTRLTTSQAHRPGRPSLAQSLAIMAWLQQDLTSYAARQARDGAVPVEGTDIDMVLQWWHALAPDTGTRGLDPAASWVLSLWTLAGAFAGVVVTTAALHYSGAHPINLFVLFALLLGVPTLSLAVLLVGAGWRAVRRSDNVSIPGRLVASWLTRLDVPGLDAAIGQRRHYARVLYWLAGRYNQAFAVGFFAAAIATLWLHVAFTDLAFGWSTTLQVAPATLTGVTDALSWPWHGWLPAAVPTQELIALSQYQRLDRAPLADAQALGAWWPFVMMCLVVWGLLPRLLLSWISRRGLALSAQRLLLSHPDVQSLLLRLKQPVGTVTRVAPDTAAASPPPGEAAPTSAATPAHLAGAPCISWNGADQEGPATPVTSLQSPDEWRRLVGELLGDTPADPFVVYTKAWEPPMLEFVDFISTLREVVGPQSTIVVAPLALAGDDETDAAAQTAVWAQTLARVADDRLVVHRDAVEATSR